MSSGKFKELLKPYQSPVRYLISTDFQRKGTTILITKPINPGDSSEASNSKLAGYTGNDTADNIINEKKNIGNESSDSEGKGSEMDTPSPSDPVEDLLRWLDDGLPGLSGYNRRELDLALEFDIQPYVDILKKDDRYADDEWGRWE